MGGRRSPHSERAGPEEEPRGGVRSQGAAARGPADKQGLPRSVKDYGL